MGRAKLNLELIPKEKARNLTFKKRKEGIMKKMREFTTLCDVNACMIIYGPNCQSSEPAIWPNNRSEVERMIELYKEKGADNSTRAYGLSNFFMDRKKKLEEEVKKLKQKNLEAKYPTCLEFMDRLSKSELENFVRFLNAKLEASTSRLEMINGIKQEEEPQTMQHFQGYNHDYIHPIIDPIQMDNLGFVNPLQQVVYNPNFFFDDQEKHYGMLNYANPNPGGMIPMMNEAEYMQFGGASSSGGGSYSYNNENVQVGYRQKVNYYEPMGGGMNNGGVMAQYYMDRTTMQLAVAPPYMGGDLPPLPPCYLEVNEVKSACTLPALAGSVNLPQMPAAAYHLEEKETNNTSPLPVGSGSLPQLASYYHTEENESGSSINHYQITNQIKRY